MDKLTREQIAAMTPEQLRLAVAEHVMGWKWQETKSSPGWFGLKLYENDVYYGALRTNEETHIYDVLPNYPEDIAAAWMVAEEFQRKDGVDNILCDAFYHELWKHPALYTIPSTEAATIICRAALEAMRRAPLIRAVSQP